LGRCWTRNQNMERGWCSLHFIWKYLRSLRKARRTHLDTQSNECYEICYTFQGRSYWENITSSWCIGYYWKMVEGIDSLDKFGICLFKWWYCKTNANWKQKILEHSQDLVKDNGKSSWTKECHLMLHKWYLEELTRIIARRFRVLLKETRKLFRIKEEYFPQILFLFKCWFAQDSISRKWS
jgi:hypothetical protein